MKLGKLALVGALALGGFTGLATLDAKPAAAAGSVAEDNWGFRYLGDFADIYHMDAEMHQLVKKSYKTGDLFTISLKKYGAYTSDDIVKIYKVEDNASLNRYKTIASMPIGSEKIVWQTQITDAYGPGTYVAVAYIAGAHWHSDTFTINK
ncbi:DUF5065 domain-containing protein [Bacillus wiedmannii]|uniref:DUF5065 family protein n=1 Tax=Bacillus wiedmannii TaxID=1890302 RepID=UPI000BF2A45E|nr:DUF5065 family protein [Bacillus wiedmannii]PGC22779.1 DUF5065 domain-containing protein [Bacillus wiedmannii]